MLLKKDEKLLICGLWYLNLSLAKCLRLVINGHPTKILQLSLFFMVKRYYKFYLRVFSVAIVAHVSAWFLFRLGIHCFDLEAFKSEGEFDGAGWATDYSYFCGADLKLVALEAARLGEHEAGEDFETRCSGSPTSLRRKSARSRVCLHAEACHFGRKLKLIWALGHFLFCLVSMRACISKLLNYKDRSLSLEHTYA